MLEALNKILNENKTDHTATSAADNFTTTIKSFKFILIMLFFKKIFYITREVSRYLQSKNIDFIRVINLVNIVKKCLIDMRCKRSCNNLIDQTKTYAIEKLQRKGFQTSKTLK